MNFIPYSYYKNIRYVRRGIKTNSRPKNSTAPPGFEIPGSAQGRSQELEMGGAKLLGEGSGGHLRPN